MIQIKYQWKRRIIVLLVIEILSQNTEIGNGLGTKVKSYCEAFVPKCALRASKIPTKRKFQFGNPLSSSSSDLGEDAKNSSAYRFGFTQYYGQKKNFEIPDFFLRLKDNYNPKKPLSTSSNIVHQFEHIEDKRVLEETIRLMITQTIPDDQYSLGDKSSKRTLVSLLTPRDQTSLIRYLGSRGMYYTMSCLLKHLASNLNLYTQTNESNNTNQFSNIQYAYSAAIRAFAQSSNPKYRERTTLLLDEMDNFGIPPNSYIITAVFLSVDGGKAARELIKRTRSYKNIDIDVRIYNAAIYACSRTYSDTKNGWESALSLFREMRRDGLRPNQQTYASLLQACAKSGQVKVAFSLFEEMKKTPNMDISNVKVWGAILRACSVAGEWEKAISLVLEMHEKRVTINVIHMNAVLASFAKVGEESKALEVLNAMHHSESVCSLKNLIPLQSRATISSENQVEFCLPKPDLVSLNTVLAVLADRSKNDEAMELLNRVKLGEFSYRRGSKWIYVKPDIVSYNSVLSTFQEPQEALSFIHEIRMTRKNRYNPIKPSCQTYTIAISICSRSEPPDLATALSLLKDAQIKDGLKANHFMYSATIWTAERCNDAKCALTLLNNMKNERCRPNTACYNGVLAILGKKGMLVEAIAVIFDMKRNHVPLGPSTFQYLVNAASKSHLEENTVLEKYEQILSILNKDERHVMQSGQLYNALIRGYGSVGKIDEALRIFHGLKQTNTQCLSSILFVCSISSPARWREAIMILHSSDIVVGAQGPGKIEAMALSYAIIACSKENEWEEAINLLELYGTGDENQVPKVSVDAINSIIAAAGRTGRPDVSVKVLNEISMKYFLKPNERSYRSAIIACNQAEHRMKLDAFNGDESNAKSNISEFIFRWWEVAVSLLRRMQEDGLEPSTQAYSSVISACEAAGQWQRAIGILGLMNRYTKQKANLYCFNAALAACEKGNAWLEAVELYERIKVVGLKPNFVSLNSLLIVLEKGGQKELAESMYRQALTDKVLSPWKYTMDDINQQERIRAMDLHQFSVPMAKIAVRNVIDSLLLKSVSHDINRDLVIILGKGKGSLDGKSKLMPSIQKLLKEEYDLNPSMEVNNPGRIRINKSALKVYTQTRRWK